MREIYAILDKLAPSELSLVIEGETGTGKEMVAREIHDNSQRTGQPLVIFDCSAFPRNLLESELFGHEKGAFSGAIRTHRGVFERADGGTVFLDEIGEMDLPLQPKLLRALESGEFRRVGGERPIQVDVRVLAATNRDLAVMVEEGSFRQDLYYRLAKVRLTLPPLRDRREDIATLAGVFLERLLEQDRAGALVGRRLAEETMDLLRQYDWPGNVRELRNVVERAATFAEREEIRPRDLPSELASEGGYRPRAQVLTESARLKMPFKDAKEILLASFEREYVVELLHKHGMNISAAAREAGLDRRHIYRLMRKYEIPLPERGRVEE
jgi:transcriptional regulator with GAF, ATPase, and Fis domain